jgi:hypothetical protein
MTEFNLTHRGVGNFPPLAGLIRAEKAGASAKLTVAVRRGELLPLPN